MTYWVHPILRSPLLIKEQRDYHGRFKVYFRMSEAQFDALLVITKTTNVCELCVQGCLQCFVLRDEVDELDNRHSGFWHSLRQGKARQVYLYSTFHTHW